MKQSRIMRYICDKESIIITKAVTADKFIKMRSVIKVSHKVYNISSAISLYTASATSICRNQ